MATIYDDFPTSLAAVVHPQDPHRDWLEPLIDDIDGMLHDFDWISMGYHGILCEDLAE